jgi:hypothetical protein
LTATNGPVLRADMRCTKRASTSLPVPDSPTMSTVQSLAATRRASSSNRCDEAALATGCGSRARRALLETVFVESWTIQTPNRNAVAGRAVQEPCPVANCHQSVMAVTRSGRNLPPAVNLPSPDPRWRDRNWRAQGSPGRACAISQPELSVAGRAGGRRARPCPWSVRAPVQ